MQEAGELDTTPDAVREPDERRRQCASLQPTTVVPQGDCRDRSTCVDCIVRPGNCPGDLPDGQQRLPTEGRGSFSGWRRSCFPG